ncbi:polymorphic toxin type 24 domain-containing protein [Coleofasciculus sp. B1-GNL1-01]|uniref:polymorphic toxin type 24 domain-containing protein n=1 Tax=Coleofasciculus sp. B1-GNL1-01 TaxID=3068484 RepID=UPI0040628F9C
MFQTRHGASLHNRRFPLDGASVREVRYRLDDGNITSYIVYDDNGRAIKRVDLTGKAHAGTPTPILKYR